ncbi:MAG: amidohydrolase family protein [Deltaproteobacteria bacterium]|nr:amidohydrolase family protein [Deltaproteobacteria bacterium]
MLDELILVNGHIHTMDDNGTVVSSVAIEGGRIAAMGDDLKPRGPDARIIDLKGHTVIPGLIDNHVHFLRMGLLPGHDMRELETAFSLGDALARIAERASTVPEGEPLSALGGIHPNQFREKRYPTLKELDDAAPRHPVYLSVSNFGPGATNSRARDLLRARGVPVADDGAVAPGDTTYAAWEALSATRAPADVRRQTMWEIEHALSLGLVCLFDMGGTIPAGGFLDPRTGYVPILELMRAERLPLRLRLFLPVQDDSASLPEVTARLDHTFNEFGNDMLRVVGFGEWLIPSRLQSRQPLPEFYTASVRAVAERGWIYKQHMITLPEQCAHLDVWEAVNRTYPVGELHWSMDHCYGLDETALNRCKDLGIGISAHGSPYLEGAPLPTGNPPFRMIVDSGVPAGSGSDGARIAPINPWLMIYYALTGINSAGKPINAHQTIDRDEALRLWTSGQGWFSKEDAHMGGLGVGKFGDLAVLDRNYFDTDAVADADVRHIRSVLTVVGGQVVHDAGVVAA